MTEQIVGHRGPLLDNSGAPLSGGSVDVFAQGTNTRVTTYSDSRLTQTNPNPVPISGSGRASIWVDRAVDVRVKDDTGVTVAEDLNLNPSTITGGFDSGFAPNGGFELDSDSDGIPDGWVNDVNASGSNNGLETGASNVFSGTRSWRTQSTGSGGGELASLASFDVNEVDSLLVRFRLRSTVAAVRNIVRIEWRDSTDTIISTSTIYDSATNPATFTETVVSTAPPSGARLARLRLIGGASGGTLTGITYWDNVRAEYPPVLTGAFDNLLLAGNTLSSTDTNGDIILDPNGTGTVSVVGPLSVSTNATVTGTLGITGLTTAADLTVTGTATVSGTFTTPNMAIFTSFLGIDLTDSNAPIRIGDETVQHLELDRSAIMSKSNATTVSTLRLNEVGGNVIVGGTVSTGNVLLRNEHVSVEGAAFYPLRLRNRADGVPAVGAAQQVGIEFARADGLAIGRVGYNANTAFSVTCLNNLGRLELRATDGSSVEHILLDGLGGGNVRQYYDAVIQTETQAHNTGDAVTGMTVRHRDGVFYDAGMAVVPQALTHTSGDRTIIETDVGKLVRWDGGGNLAFNVNANIPIGAWGYFWNTTSSTISTTGTAGLLGPTALAVNTVSADTLMKWFKINASQFLLVEVS